MNTNYVKKTFIKPATVIAPPESTDKEGIAKLYSLINGGNFGQIIDYLLEKSLDLNSQYEGKIIFNEVINIPNEKSSEAKKIEFLKYLLENRRVSINSYDAHGNTPLHCAVKHGYKEIVNFLLENNSNVDSISDNKLTPLHYATLITLKDCPKENIPLNLIERERNKNSKINELSKLMIKNMNGTDKNITDNNGDAVNILKKFNDNIDSIEKIYFEILKGSIDHDGFIVNLEKNYKSDVPIGVEVVKKLTDTYIRNLNAKITFPLDIMSAAMNPPKTYNEYMDEAIDIIEESFKDKFNKPINNNYAPPYNEIIGLARSYFSACS